MNRARFLSSNLLPFFLSGLLLLVFHQGAGWKDDLSEERQGEIWNRRAASLLALLRNRITLAAQLEGMGFRLADRVTSAARSRSRVRPEEAAAILARSFRASVPPTHRPAGTLVFGVLLPAEGPPLLLSGPGLETSRGRLMSDILADFAAIQAAGAVSSARKRKMAPRVKGMFGDSADGTLLGLSRRGRLSPAQFAGESRHLLWNVVPLGPDARLAYAILFPQSLETTVRPEMFALNLISRLGRGRFHPLLVPLRPDLAGVSPLLPTTGEKGLRPALDRLLAEAAEPRTREARFPLSRVSVGSGFRVKRDFLSLDHPYEAWIVSPVRPRFDGNRRALRPAWTLFALFWIAFFVIPAVRGRSWDISLRTSFLATFFLVASLPLAAFYVIQAGQIEMSIVRQLDEMADGLWKKLRLLDVDQALVRKEFYALTQRALASDRCQGALRNPAEGLSTGLSRRLFGFFTRGSSSLDILLQLRPRRFAQVFSRNAQDADRVGRVADFFVPFGREVIRRYVSEKDPEEIFPLTRSQGELLAQLPLRQDQFGGAADSLEGGADLVKPFGGPGYLVFFSVFSLKGKFHTALMFIGEAEKALRLLLIRIATQLTLREGMRETDVNFCLCRRQPGGVLPIYPHPQGSFWNSGQGKAMRQVMNAASEANHPGLGRKHGGMQVAKVCGQTPEFVVGAFQSTRGMVAASHLERQLLLIVLTLVSLILFALGKRLATYLFEPLRDIRVALQDIQAGGLPGPLQLPRDDELGDLSRTFDTMVAGLRQRRHLGRFVSGTLNRSLDRGAAGFAAASVQEIPAAVVLVSDLRSFTTISERHAAPVVVAMLNAHLDAMSQAIEEAGGQIDRFIGDAVVALFADPDPGVAVGMGLKAGLGMHRRHRQLQADRRARQEFPYEIGIGIALGPVLAGNLVTAGRSEFTLFGPPRDEAEHLEAASKEGRHTRIVVSGEVRELAEPGIRFEPIGEAAFELAEVSNPGGRPR